MLFRSLAVIAGEASGDALALRFLTALRERLGDRPVELCGVGDHGLPEAGLKPLFPQADIAVMGFGPVIARLPLLLRRMEDAARGIAAFQPDLLLTIDSPDFCLRVAKKVAFDDLGAHRLWLDVKTHNTRAKALYDSEGFVVEGLLRESVRTDSGFESLVVMSMLQSEFTARRSLVLEVPA